MENTMDTRKVFTTGQVAKICKVSGRTVANWCDNNKIKWYRIPGSRERRIVREHLLPFLKERGISLEETNSLKVLLVSDDETFTSQFAQSLKAQDSFDVATKTSMFEAGIEYEKSNPTFIIVDFSLGLSEAVTLCKLVRKNDNPSKILIIAIVQDDQTFDSKLVNEVFKKPFKLDLFVSRFRTLVSQNQGT
jgi:excisionase family DNA binding protein